MTQELQMLRQMSHSTGRPFGRPLRSLALAAALLTGLAACGGDDEEAKKQQAEAEQPAPPKPAPAPVAQERRKPGQSGAGLYDPAAAAASAQRAAEPSVTKTSAYARIEKVLIGPQRTAEERARDGYRHPLETLNFFEIDRDHDIIEITPGSGWYAAILSPVVYRIGTYIAAVPDEKVPGQPEYVARLNQQLTDRFAKGYQYYGLPVPLRRFNPDQPVFGPPASSDMVLSFRNAHNWIEAGTAEAYFHGFFEVLRPGGTLGIVDHRAAEGPATDGSTGYVTEQQIIDLATGAGFRLAARSEINANPKDTRDHPDGVWTLPPSYALGDVDRDKYKAIGESDRMTLKFVKP